MFACAASYVTSALLALTLSPQCGVPRLEADPAPPVLKHVGDGAVSCGRLWCRSSHGVGPTDEQVAKLQLCMGRAYRETRSFFFSIEDDGVDSYVATGLMRRGSGPLQRFWFDSNPSPTPGVPGSFVVADCPAPVNPERIDPFLDCTRGIKRSPTRR